MLIAFALAASLCCANSPAVDGTPTQSSSSIVRPSPHRDLVKWPGTKRKKGERGRKDKEGKRRNRDREADGSDRGKCGRLAEKHGIPKSECRKMSGEKKCRRLAEKHGLPREACKSL
jgi:hypothetical protein